MHAHGSWCHGSACAIAASRSSPNGLPATGLDLCDLPAWRAVAVQMYRVKIPGQYRPAIVPREHTTSGVAATRSIPFSILLHWRMAGIITSRGENPPQLSTGTDDNPVMDGFSAAQRCR